MSWRTDGNELDSPIVRCSDSSHVSGYIMISCVPQGEGRSPPERFCLLPEDSALSNLQLRIFGRSVLPQADSPSYALYVATGESRRVGTQLWLQYASVSESEYRAR